LYDVMSNNETAEHCCALVRLFVTQPFRELDEERGAFAHTTATGSELTGDTPCLVLLASNGKEPDWNDRRASRGHQAIPLVSEEAIRQSPMISQLLSQFGVEIS